MTGPAATDRTHRMVEAYIRGASLREVAAEFGVSPQRVHAVVRIHAPKVLKKFRRNIKTDKNSQQNQSLEGES